ncbi:MAG: tRNA lysidine(34) synthetase TilS [Kiloniellaceae bacterium]
MAAAVTADDFGRLMALVGPFEPQPHVAAAVSGGPDSLALAVLLQDWLAARGGRLTVFTVDHRLRQDSAAEAVWVGRVMKQRGIPHHTLRWRGVKPAAPRQAAARAARYDLLLKACETRGIFHLVFAHHLEDQAETFLLRLGRGSGLDGLAAMPAVSETSGLRLLRPLLGLPKARLRATLEAAGLTWVEDPSNDDGAFARVRLRRLLPDLAGHGMTPARLGHATENLGRARAALEADVAAALARAVRTDPAGFLLLDPAALARESDEVSLRALARCLMAAGGCDYTPRLERLARLHRLLRGGLAGGATLGGCRILPCEARWLVVREAGRTSPAALRPGGSLLWDGRFRVRLARGQGAGGEDMTVGPLGRDGWRGLVAALKAAGIEGRAVRLPAAARGALPALRDRQGLAAVPPVGYFRDESTAKRLKECRFAPTNGLTNPAFTVV